MTVAYKVMHDKPVCDEDCCYAGWDDELWGLSKGVGYVRPMFEVRQPPTTGTAIALNDDLPYVEADTDYTVTQEDYADEGRWWL